MEILTKEYLRGGIIIIRFEKKYVELIKNILIFGFGLIGTKLIQFLLLPYFTNVLSTAEYGVIDLVVTFVGLMVPVLTLELSDAVLRFGLSDETDKKDLVQCSFIILVLCVILTICFSPLLVYYRTILPYRNYVVFMIIAQAFRTNEALFVKSQNKVLIYAIDSMITALIIAGFDVLFISSLGIGVRGYFCAELIGNIISVFFLFFVGKIYKFFTIWKPINTILLKKMLKYSIPLMFNAISWWITSFSDRVILDVFFSESEVGIYSIAAKIPAIITTLLSVFTQAWIMSAVKEYEKDNNTNFFEKIYKIYSGLLFVSVGFVILIIKPIMRLCIGADFFEAWYFVPILLLGTSFLGISNYYGALYAAAKANMLEIKSTIICAISNIVLNILLIPQISILGAVLATMMSYLIVVIVRMIDVRRIILINREVKDFIISSTVLFCEIFFCMKEQLSLMLLSYLLLILWKAFKIKNANNNL